MDRVIKLKQTEKECVMLILKKNQGYFIKHETGFVEVAANYKGVLVSRLYRFYKNNDTIRVCSGMYIYRTLETTFKSKWVEGIDDAKCFKIPENKIVETFKKILL